jgi:hypothetical protein
MNKKINAWSIVSAFAALCIVIIAIETPSVISSGKLMGGLIANLQNNTVIHHRSGLVIAAFLLFSFIKNIYFIPKGSSQGIHLQLFIFYTENRYSSLTTMLLHSHGNNLI